MDLGYVALGVARGFDFVGYFGASGVEKVVGLGCVRSFVGSGVDDESGAGLTTAILAGMGGALQARRRPGPVGTYGLGGWRGHPMLFAVDDSQLCGVSSGDSSALEFTV